MAFNNRFGQLRYDFNGNLELGQLTASRGTRVTVLEHVDDKWLRCATNSAVGLVPKSYIDFSAEAKSPTGKALIIDTTGSSAGVGRSGVTAAVRSSTSKAVAREEANTATPDHATATVGSPVNVLVPDTAIAEPVLTRSVSLPPKKPARKHVALASRSIPEAESQEPLADQQLALLQLEMSRLRAELSAKDELLDEMQASLQDKSQQADELLAESRAISMQTEELLRAQLEEKDKQLDILQTSVDNFRVSSLPLDGGDPAYLSAAPTETQANGSGSSVSQSPRKDRAFMDDFLLSVLEQKDTLQDEVHDLSNQLAETKAKLGMMEYERERAETDRRMQDRRRANGERPISPAPVLRVRQRD